MANSKFYRDRYYKSLVAKKVIQKDDRSVNVYNRKCYIVAPEHFDLELSDYCFARGFRIIRDEWIHLRNINTIAYCLTIDNPKISYPKLLLQFRKLFASTLSIHTKLSGKKEEKWVELTALPSLADKPVIKWMAFLIACCMLRLIDSKFIEAWEQGVEQGSQLVDIKLFPLSSWRDIIYLVHYGEHYFVLNEEINRRIGNCKKAYVYKFIDEWLEIVYTFFGAGNEELYKSAAARAGVCYLWTGKHQTPVYQFISKEVMRGILDGNV